MIRAAIQFCGMIVGVEESDFKGRKRQKGGFPDPGAPATINISGCVSALSPEVAFNAWQHVGWKIGSQKISLFIDDTQGTQTGQFLIELNPARRNDIQQSFIERNTGDGFGCNQIG